MNWSEVTERVVIEACAAHPDDVVVDLGCGDGRIATALAGKVRRVVAVDHDPAVVAAYARVAPANVRVERGDARTFTLPPGTSVIVLHDVLRFIPRGDRKALFERLGKSASQRCLLVVGDVMWSLPAKDIDEPEQFGQPPGDPPTTKEVEDYARAAGFLPDLHRFGVGRAVLVALRGER